jgi:hypothetical protein
VNHCSTFERSGLILTTLSFNVDAHAFGVTAAGHALGSPLSPMAPLPVAK